MENAVNRVFGFGDFEVDAERRLLLKGGRPVTLKSKTFDLLLVLVENHERVLTKNDLLDRVWENQFVEENNLTVHVAALRKALGETKDEHRFIVTVPGKGYRFVADVNTPTNGDLVVEHHKFARIRVAEEVVERDDRGAMSSTNGHGPLPAPSRQTRQRVRFVVIAAAALLGVAGLAATGYLFRERLFVSAAAPFVEHRGRQLTTNGKVGTAALSPDGKLFAYTVDDVGQKSLWLGYVDGGNHLQIRPAAESIYATLTFSPDSSHLYYSVREGREAFALFRVPVFGGPPQKVLDDVGSFALSPDGKQIALGGSDKDTHFLVVARLDGPERRHVTSFPSKLSFRWDTVSWSADGERLAFSVIRDSRTYYNEIGVLEIASGEVTRVPLENWREITKTAWLNDGSGLIITAIEESSHSSVPQYRLVHVALPSGRAEAITADRSNYGASWHNDAGVSLSLSSDTKLLLAVEHRQLSNVWVAPTEDLAAARQITFSSFGKYDGLWGMDWTPDGRLIYTTSDTTSQFLSQMNADGGEQKPITAAGHVDSVLTVSHDGRYILFHSNRGGDFDIWRTDIDGSHAKQLTFGGKGFQPAPSPDGRWVYYRNRLGTVARLCRVAIEGGESECLTDKETAWMSFSPDGKYLAALYITDKQRLAIFSAATNALLKQFELPLSATLYMGSRWTPDSRAVTYRDNTYGYWVQPIDGGEPRRLDGLPKEKLYNFSWSRDGKMLAYVRGQEIRDVVLMETAGR